MKKTMLAVLTMFSAPAFASGYLGFGAGVSTFDMDTTPYTTGTTEIGGNLKVFGGVDTGTGLGFEAGYASFGPFTQDYAGTVTDYPDYITDSYGNDEVEGSALYLALVASTATGTGLDLFAKGGITQWVMSHTYSDTHDVYDYMTGTYLGSTSGSYTEDKIGVGTMWGLGASFNIADDMAIRAEFERFMDVGDEDVFQKDVDVYSVSAVLRF